MRQILTLSAVFLLLGCTLAVAGIPSGIVVRERSATAVDFQYTPVISGWDTTVARGTTVIDPRIPGAVVRSSEDGSVLQWVMYIDVIVPGEQLFRVDRADVSTVNNQASLPFRAEFAEKEAYRTALRPLPSNVTVWYDGIAGNRHIARIGIIVVSRAHGSTTITRSASVRITMLAPPGVRGTSSLPLDVINPDATWTVNAAETVFAKGAGETVQNNETYSAIYRMPIEREGIYRITADQLRSAGIATDAQTAQTITVLGYGGLELPERVDSALVNKLRQQPIMVRTNADGTIRDIIFYASGNTGWRRAGTTIEHYIHHYSTSNSYYLALSTTASARAQARAAERTEPTTRPALVTGRVFNEEELVSPYSQGSGRRWFGRSIENGGSISINTVLPGLVRSGEVLYRFVVAHRGTIAGTVNVSESGTPVASANILAVPKYMDAYSTLNSGSINAAMLPADARSVLRFAYTCQDRASNGNLDWFEIHYPRQQQAHDGEFEFWTVEGSGVHEYSVNGFGSELFGLDVTDRTRPVWIENVASTGGMFVVREAPGATPRRYFLSSNLRQTTLSRVNIANLRTQNRQTELIIITHAALLASAQRYADYRISTGVPSTVVTTEEIFAEFSYGMQDPTAIRDFLAFANANWTPRPTAVLFWGDGHYDYKNISTPAANYIIPYESLDPDDRDYGLVTYTTDDFFVRIVGNDPRPDLSIGRLPITDNATGDRMLAKIRAYESDASLDDWRARITLIADDGQQGDGLSDGDTHVRQSETLVNNYVPKEFQSRKIYLVEYPTENVARGRRKPTVTQDMVSTINTSGSLILNWIGHGNPRVWAHEQIFTRETTPSLMTNASKPYFLTAATCDFSRWDMTDIQSGGEELVLSTNGGAIGVFSAARVVFSLANADLNQEFYSDLFERDAQGNYPTVGQAMMKVKQKYNGNNDEKFLLLADPMLRLLVPTQKVRFTAINGAPISATEPPTVVSALSTVEIEGEIVGTVSSDIDGSFNGNVSVSLMDATRTVTVVDTDIYNTVNTFTKSGPALCRGSFKVTNGKFVASFVVPKDISFSTQNAGLYGYAASEDRRFAMGVTDRVVVDGVTTVLDPESDGPTMNIYLDSRAFLPGSIVRPNPILIVDLEDATGINTTGVGIGHDIEARFNDGARTEVLTSTFTTSLLNSRAGTAQSQIFGLGDGLHTVTVQAWDVLNNVSTATTTFRIVTSTTGIPTGGLSNYPNPFASTTTVRFVHASPRPFDATLQIYDLDGRKVWEQQMRILDMQTADVQWTGLDMAGSPMPSGIYQAVVRLVDDSGATSFASGKLHLIR